MNCTDHEVVYGGDGSLHGVDLIHPAKLKVLEANRMCLHTSTPKLRLDLGICPYLIITCATLHIRCRDWWMMTYLLTHAIKARSPKLICLTQYRVEWFRHSQCLSVVLRYAECHNVTETKSWILFTVCLDKQLLVLHDLDQLLQHADGLVDYDRHRDLCEVLADRVFDDLPNRHLLPGWLLVRKLHSLVEVQGVWIRHVKCLVLDDGAHIDVEAGGRFINHFLVFIFLIVILITKAAFKVAVLLKSMFIGTLFLAVAGGVERRFFNSRFCLCLMERAGTRNSTLLRYESAHLTGLPTK